MTKLGTYINGNYTVSIYDDGTKIRETDENEFIPNRLESCDCKITNRCDMGCKQCHEKSTVIGKHGDLSNPIIQTFLPYTEIAIGGGNPLAHPDLENFLVQLKSLKCFPNMTVNQIHFEQDIKKLKRYRDAQMIYGLGISLMNVTPEFAARVREFPNAVVHVIAGIVTLEQLQQMSQLGIDKILILGYKRFGRGKDYYNETIKRGIFELADNLSKITKMFKVVSFDNLAIEQLNVRSLLTEEEWNEFYMGDDGGYTMYIDLVEQKYAQSSVSDIRFPISEKETINDMFLDIRSKKI